MKKEIDVKKILEEVERIDDVMNKTSLINESSLSRVWSHSEKFDIAIITAFRGKNSDCVKGDNDGHKFSFDENMQRNRELHAVLLDKGYLITKIKGSYIEHFNTPQAVEKSEKSFFVVNRNNDDQFFSTIIKLGKYFCQDSVLLKPLNEDAYLYGTNNNIFPGLDKKSDLGKFKGGNEAEFMSRVKNRPFYFGETYEDYGMGGKQVIKKISKNILDEINEL